MNHNKVWSQKFVRFCSTTNFLRAKCEASKRVCYPYTQKAFKSDAMTWLLKQLTMLQSWEPLGPKVGMLPCTKIVGKAPSHTDQVLDDLGVPEPAARHWVPTVQDMMSDKDRGLMEGNRDGEKSVSQGLTASRFWPRGFPPPIARPTAGPRDGIPLRES